jgi:hypothetical protein
MGTKTQLSMLGGLISITKCHLFYSTTNSVCYLVTISGRSNECICTLTHHLLNEFGDPESFGQIHEMVQCLVQSRFANIWDNV